MRPILRLSEARAGRSRDNRLMTDSTSAPGRTEDRTTGIGESRGIRVRPFVPADVEPYRRWLQPHQDWHRWDGPYFPKLDVAGVDAACARLASSIADGSYGAHAPLTRAVIVTADGPATMLGTVSWHWESEVSDWRRMGLTVYDPTQRGRGVGTEALRLWTEYLFRTTSVVRLDFATWSGNERMLAVGHRLGFVEEARFRDAREVRGRRYDSVVMGVLRDEWESSGQRPGQGASSTS